MKAPRFHSIVLAPIMLGLLLIPGSVQGQPAGSESLTKCAIDAGVENLLHRCETGAETGSACALARISRALVNADEGEALWLMQKELDFDVAAAADLLPAFQLLGLFAVGPFEPMSACAARASGGMTSLLQQAISGLTTDTWLVLWPLLGWNEALLPAIEAKARPDRIESLRRSREGVEVFIEASTHSAAFGQTDQAQDIWNLIAGGMPTLTPEPQEQGPGPDDSPPLGWEGIERATEAGIENLGTGRLEEAARHFARVEKALEAMDPDSPRIQGQLRLTRWFRVATFEEMNADDEAERMRSRIAPPRPDTLDATLDLIGQSLLEKGKLEVEEIWRKVMAQAQSGHERAAEVEILWEILLTAFPSLSHITSMESPTPPGPQGGAQGAQTSMPPLSGLLGGAFPQMATDLALDLSRGEYDSAADKAMELFDRFPRHDNLGLLFRVILDQWNADDRRGALTNGLRGLARMEYMVAGMEVEELRRSFLDGMGNSVYEAVLSMALEIGDLDIAFQVAERGRAWDVRSRWGALLQAEADGEPSDPSAEELAALRALAIHEQKVESTDVAAWDSWHLERSELRADFRHHRRERILRRSGGGGLAETPSPPSLHQVRSWLPADWSLLSYSSYADTLWVFVIDPNTGSHLERLPLSTDELEGLVGTVEGARPTLGNILVEESRGGVVIATQRREAALHELYEKLIAPVRGQAKGKGLLIVPHGPMVRIPFAALEDEKSFLVQDFALAQIPSVSALELWQKRALEKRDESRCGRVEVWGPPAEFAQGLPWLRGAEREAKEVARALSSKPRLGEDVRESALYGMAPDIDLLHIATHGEYPPENPLFGRLHLGADDEEDGFLDFHEVWDHLDLRRAQLVTLSGCETGLGETTRADDVLGMTTAFLAAGSRSVISTLWRVPDVPSAELMIAFYQSWQEGKTAAAALQAAQVEMLEKGRSYLSWAGYVLSGDPTTTWLFSPKPPKRCSKTRD